MNSMFYKWYMKSMNNKERIMKKDYKSKTTWEKADIKSILLRLGEELCW